MTTTKIHILLTENNEADASIVQNDLQRAIGGHITVVRTRRLSCALELLQKQSFDLILSDLTLPNSDGIEAIYQLQKNAVSVSIAVFSFKMMRNFYNLSDKSRHSKLFDQGKFD